MFCLYFICLTLFISVHTLVLLIAWFPYLSNGCCEQREPVLLDVNVSLLKARLAVFRLHFLYLFLIIYSRSRQYDITMVRLSDYLRSIYVVLLIIIHGRRLCLLPVSDTNDNVTVTYSVYLI